ncbi:non-ribosomal peptide synthetase, partial [Rhodanobacter sp. ANJX3]|uniref:non-ribosomal peptide synthetase n=1 Tax=Rhodanobacter sp. ANJX3 TaxID=2723083 RepID=UPI00210255E0
MLSLIDLEQDDIDRIVAAVPGGVANIQDIYALSPLQDGVLFHHLLAEQSDPYELRTWLTFPNRDVLQRFLDAVQRVVDRHDILRTGFVWSGLSTAAQVVLRSARLRVDEITATNDHADPKAAIEAWLEVHSMRMNVTAAPLLSYTVLHDKISDAWVVLQRMHHLVGDHSTLDMLHGDVHTIMDGREADLPRPTPYKAAIARMRRSGASEEHEAFFRELLADVTEPTLPFQLVDIQQDGRAMVEFGEHLPTDLVARVFATARRRGVSVAALCHTAFGQMVARASGRDDVVFGTVLFGRLSGDSTANRAAGVFINTLPFRLRLGDDAVLDVVKQAQARLGALLHHEHAPLSLAKACSGLPMTSPLFSAVLNMRHSAEVAIAPDALPTLLSTVAVTSNTERSNYPLGVSIDQGSDSLQISAQTVREIDPQRIVSYIRCALVDLCDALESDASVPAHTLEIFDRSEQSVVADALDTIPAATDFCTLFDRWVDDAPEALAIVHGPTQLTYGELDARAETIADLLVEKGIGVESLVVICAERGIVPVVCMLGAFKAGAAYVTLDPAQGRDRLAHMLDDTGAFFVLCDATGELALEGLTSGRVVRADRLAADSTLSTHRGEATAAVRDPRRLAYVVYTSGSTGRPKGAMIEHRGLVNLTIDHAARFGIAPGSRVLQFASLGFDASVLEIMLALGSGASLHIAPDDARHDIRKLWSYIDAQRISFGALVPSFIQGVTDLPPLAHPLTLILGGEAPSLDLMRRMSRLATIHNGYGPAENTVCTTMWAFQPDAERVLLGTPIANQLVDILDSRGRLVPDGAIGELVVSGVGVARGYLNLPELTAMRFFVDDRVGQAVGLRYRTGDLVRRGPEGLLEYIGRIDNQVKLRGFRIEPGEIENQLRLHPDVAEAVVTVRDDAGTMRCLCAYVVRHAQAGHSGVDVDDLPNALRTHLATKVPEYMIPACFVAIDAIPLTVGGKIDHRALPIPDDTAFARRAYEAPASMVEERLAAVWQAILQIQRVGRRDHFFELGGHSLNVVTLIGRLQKEGLSLTAKDAFNHPVLSDMAKAITQDVTRGAPANRIPVGAQTIEPSMLPLISLTVQDIETIVSVVPGGASNIQDIYGLTPMQDGILFHHRLASGVDPYVLVTDMDFPDRSVVDAFLGAVATVVQRHDILRSAFLWEGLSRPVQVVLRSANLQVTDLSLADHANVASVDVDDLVSQLPLRLDVGLAPLLQYIVTHNGVDGGYRVQQRYHHLIGDHSTLDVLRSEVYTLLEGRGHELPDAEPFREQLWKIVQGPAEAEHEAFFRDMLGHITAPTLPFGLSNVMQHGRAVVEATAEVDPEITARLRDHARRLGVSAASLCHFAWAHVLGRTAGTDDVVFGTVLLGRMQSGRSSEQGVGLFVNTLPLLITLDDRPVSTAVRDVHDRLVSLVHHESASLALAQRCSGVQLPSPLFSGVFNYRHNRTVALDGIDEDNHAMRDVRFVKTVERTNYPLTMCVDDFGDRLALTALVETPHSPERLVAYMSTALASLVDVLDHGANAKSSRIEVLPAEERDYALAGPIAASDSGAMRDTIHRRFERIVRRFPERIAVTSPTTALSYDALNRQANRLAHHLVELGITSDDHVAICVKREADLLVAILAVLKAGASYVPVDPVYASDRIDRILESAKPALVVADALGCAALAAGSQAIDVVDIDRPDAWSMQSSDDLTVEVSSDAVAYIIYTSGSTGEPKGVMVEHRNVDRLFDTTAAQFAFDENDVWSLFHSYGFDFTVWEIWGALLHGGRLVVVPHEVARSTGDFLELVAREGVTVVNQTPSAFKAFIHAHTSHAPIPSLRYIVLGGEAMDTSVLNDWYGIYPENRPELINMYGITETTVHVTYRRLGPADALCSSSPIGAPLDDLAIYLLDAHRQPVPVGVVGEMYVGGAGVARGYKGRPDLTEQRFLADPFANSVNSRMYRTGDLARRDEDGELEFLGRNDQQVKIRGYRIELGEIEARLSEHPSVSQAAVIGRDDSGSMRLVAYVILIGREQASDNSVLMDDIAAHLEARLPSYMLPSAYVPIDALPLTINGKLDVKALPKPAAASSSRSDEPVTPGERLLADLWSGLLGVDRVGRNDDFFRLGGHSLLAVQLIERLRQAGQRLEVNHIFSASLLADMARELAPLDAHESMAEGVPDGVVRIVPSMLPLANLSQEDIDGIVASVPGGVANVKDIYGVTPLQDGILFHHMLAAGRDPYVMLSHLVFHERDLLDRFVAALNVLIERHDILRTSFVWDGLSEPHQVVVRQATLPLIEMAGLPGATATERLHARFDPKSLRMDLTKAPLVQLAVAKDAVEDRWIAVLLRHHLVEDAVSVRIFRDELKTILEGDAHLLPAAPSFRALVAQTRGGASKAEHETFFTSMLGDVTEPTLPFGIDGAYVTDDVGEARMSVPDAVANRLRDGARRAGVSLASLCHLAWAHVIARTSGRDDVVFGTVLFGRLQGTAGADRAAGLFINTLPLRVAVANESIHNQVRETHRLLAELMCHEHASLAVAQQCSGVPAGTTLFSSLLNFRNLLPSQGDAEDGDHPLAAVEWSMGDRFTNYPVSIAVEDYGQALALIGQVVAPFSAERVCAYLCRALEALADVLHQDMDAGDTALEMLPAGEIDELVVRLNATAKIFPDSCSIYLTDLIDAQCEQTPTHTALVFGQEAWTYAQLDSEVRLATQQLVAAGVRPDDYVGVCSARGPWMLVAMLATMRAGAAYVPLDPSYPRERLLQVVEDAGLSLICADGMGVRALGESIPEQSAIVALPDPGGRPAWVDQPTSDITRDVRGDARGNAVAYAIFTSGSTGRPKGVMVEHRSIVNFILSAKDDLAFGPEGRVLGLTSISFDIAALELFLPLVTGATLVLASSTEIADPYAIQALLARHPVDLMQTTPARWQSLLDSGWKPSPGLRMVSIGEPLIAALAGRLSAHDGMLWNAYGPTETTVWSTIARIESNAVVDHGRAPSIGRPVANTRIYLLDESLRLVPFGVPGEIYIGGDGVARGYLGRADLTAARFLDDPFCADADARMYKTGDLAKYRPDGTIEHLGRNDDQLKLRGFRIELGDIESCLLDHPAVRHVAVRSWRGAADEAMLVAYVVPASGFESMTSATISPLLLAHARLRLPEYMLPSAFVALASLPLTPNGKVDRAALPPPVSTSKMDASDTAPRGPLETRLAAIWCDVLGVDAVSRESHFFELGGNSILSVRVVERLRKSGLTLELRSIFAHPVLHELAALIVAREVVVAASVGIPENATAITPDMVPLIDIDQDGLDRIIASVPGGVANIQDIYALSPLQDGILYHHLSDPANDPYVITHTTTFASRVELEAFVAAASKVVARHDILRTAFLWEGLSMPAQVVLRSADVACFYVDGPLLDVPVSQQLSAHAQQDIFDPTEAPLVRFYAAEDAAAGTWYLFQRMHHLVGDQATLQVLAREVAAFQSGLENNLTSPRPFREFIERTRAAAATDDDRAFFESMLGDVTEPTLPFGVATVHAAQATFLHARKLLSRELVASIREQAKSHRVSVASVCHLAWGLVVARAAGQTDVVFGTVLSSHQASAEADEADAGMFINTLPIRVQLADQGAQSGLRAVQASLADLLAHEYASLALVQRCSQVRAPDPLFSSILNYRHHATPHVLDTDAQWAHVEEQLARIHAGERTNYPLALSVEDFGDALALTIDAVASLSAARILSYVEVALASICSALSNAPSRHLHELDVLPTDEVALLSRRHSDARVPLDAHVRIHHLIEAQVRCSPDALAVRDDDRGLTYRQLDEWANRVAHRLVEEGVGSGTLVALCAERSVALVIGMLAVLKAGAAYVPIDPAYPRERVDQMLVDALPRVILTDQRSRALVADSACAASTILLDDVGTGNVLGEWLSWPGTPLPRSEATHADDLAYVIFTSGSTGRPKGVMVEHAGVVNLLRSMERVRVLDENDRVLAITSVSFDIAAVELFLPLLHGSAIVMATRAQAVDPMALQRVIEDHKVTFMQATPSTWRLLLDSGWNGTQDLSMVCGGEAMTADLAARLTTRGRDLWNVYGPTETTIWSTGIRIERATTGEQPTPTLGYPFDNTRCYALDGMGHLVPIGAIGHLHIGGAGVARGYLNRPGLTEDRFVADPFDDGSHPRMYRTGDMVRVLEDGSFAYLGRNDDQLKIRGYRIELGEIESRLVTHARVRAATVVARPDAHGDKRLVAYVVPEAAYEGRVGHHGSAPGFSLFFFGAEPSGSSNRYRLYLDAARFADEHAFEAIWTPERHFHNVGMLYPNPSVLNAALSTITKYVGLRAGSVVVPLHDPIRIAEEWAVVDNLSGGRVGIAAASGWHPRDFTLAPERFAVRKQAMADGIETIRRLWRGETIQRIDGSGKQGEVRVYPRPVQDELPLWVTAAGHPDTFIHAGRLGANVLTHLLGQNIAQLSEQIIAYRHARAEAGLDPSTGRVTVMIHAYVGDDLDETLERARGPFMRYMREHLGLLASWATSLDLEVDDVDDEAKEGIVRLAFERYSRTASLIGTPQGCVSVARQLRQAGVDEIACLIDWMDADDALAGLPALASLQALVCRDVDRDDIRSHLASTLPDFMLPSSFVVLDAFPLTPNGKIDRRALPDPDRDNGERPEHETPHGELEMSIADIWCELLGVAQAGRHDRFFDLGGHSLHVVRLLGRVAQRYAVQMPVSALFSNPTLAELARTIQEHLDQTIEPALPAIRPVSRDGRLPLSFAQQRLWFLAQIEDVSATYHVSTVLRLRGALDAVALKHSLDTLFARHESLRTVFVSNEGAPYAKLIDASRGVSMQHHSLVGIADGDAALRQLANEEVLLPFDLARGPLIRARLVAMGHNEHVLLLTQHHIVSDGWSMDILLRELVACYEA